MSISGPPNYGSSDWQRGFYSAQKLLATVPGGTDSVVVTVPPNAETIIVAVNLPSGPLRASCSGNTTGYSYPGAVLGTSPNVGGYGTLAFDAASAVDPDVTITIVPTPVTTWHVYADAAGHIVADSNVASAINFNGSPIPSSCILIGGSDGTDIRPLSVSASGVLQVSGGGGSSLYPTQSTGQVGCPTGTYTEILAAPATGYNYLFGCCCQSTSGGAGNCNIFEGPGTLNIWQTGSYGNTQPPVITQMNGFKTNSAIYGISFSNEQAVVIQYINAP